MKFHGFSNRDDMLNDSGAKVERFLTDLALVKM